MSEKYDKNNAAEDIEAIAEHAERGEDVSAHFTNRHVAKQRVNIDFPLGLLRQIDAECQRVGVPRQAWIKMVCDERLRQLHSPPRVDMPRDILFFCEQVVVEKQLSCVVKNNGWFALPNKTQSHKCCMDGHDFTSKKRHIPRRGCAC